MSVDWLEEPAPEVELFAFVDEAEDTVGDDFVGEDALARPADGALSHTSASESFADADASGSNLFVAGLPPTVDDTVLEKAFTPFGDVLSAKVMLHVDTAASRGFGFVLFKTSSHAAAAREALHGQALEGHGGKLQVSVSRHRGENLTAESRVVYIRNVPAELLGSEPLDRCLRAHGAIERLAVNDKDEETTNRRRRKQRETLSGMNIKSLVHVVVTFATPESARSCVAATHSQKPFPECQIPLLAKVEEPQELREERLRERREAQNALRIEAKRAKEAQRQDRNPEAATTAASSATSVSADSTSPPSKQQRARHSQRPTAQTSGNGSGGSASRSQRYVMPTRNPLLASASSSQYQGSHASTVGLPLPQGHDGSSAAYSAGFSVASTHSGNGGSSVGYSSNAGVSASSSHVDPASFVPVAPVVHLPVPPAPMPLMPQHSMPNSGAAAAPTGVMVPSTLVPPFVTTGPAPAGGATAVASAPRVPGGLPAAPPVGYALLPAANPLAASSLVSHVSTTFPPHAGAPPTSASNLRAMPRRS